MPCHDPGLQLGENGIGSVNVEPIAEPNTIALLCAIGLAILSMWCRDIASRLPKANDELLKTAKLLETRMQEIDRDLKYAKGNTEYVQQQVAEVREEYRSFRFEMNATLNEYEAKVESNARKQAESIVSKIKSDGMKCNLKLNNKAEELNKKYTHANKQISQQLKVVKERIGLLEGWKEQKEKENRK